MMDRIGGYLGPAFYAVQAVALGGGFVVALAGGDLDAWCEWTVPPMIGLGLVLVFGPALAGSAMTAWEIFVGMEHDPGTKTCPICGREWPAVLAYFHRQRGGRGGFQSRCRRCAFNAALGRPEVDGDA